MAHHGAHDGVDRHIQLCPLQIGAVFQVGQDLLSLVVQGGAGQHRLVPADGHLNAGVHIQRNHTGGGMGLLVEDTAASAYQSQSQTGGDQIPGSLFSRVFGHGDHSFFLLMAAREDPVQVVRRRAVHRLFQSVLHIFLCHWASSPSIWIRSFFRVRWYFESTVARGRSSRAAVSRCFRPATAWRRTTRRS